MVDHYNKATRLVLDENGPLKTKQLHVNHQQPRCSDKIKEEIRLWRKKENTWLKDPTPYTYQAFLTNAANAQNIIKSKQWRFYIDKSYECRNDFKEIFHCTNNLLSSSNQLPLPPTVDLVSLVLCMAELAYLCYLTWVCLGV